MHGKYCENVDCGLLSKIPLVARRLYSTSRCDVVPNVRALVAVAEYSSLCSVVHVAHIRTHER